MLVSGGVVNEYKRIGLMDWVLRTQLHLPRAECALRIGRKKWFSYIRGYSVPNLQNFQKNGNFGQQRKQ